MGRSRAALSLLFPLFTRPRLWLPFSHRPGCRLGPRRYRLLVPSPDVSAEPRPGCNGGYPLIELPGQFRVAVVPVRLESPQRSRVLPGLEHERGVDITDIEGPLGRHLHDDIAPGQL